MCAMCESVLRAHGLKTGFYSLVVNFLLISNFQFSVNFFYLYRSPHLLEVRERIRLNGKPLSKSNFVSYFWDCYNMLDASKVGGGTDGVISMTSFCSCFVAV